MNNQRESTILCVRLSHDSCCSDQPLALKRCRGCAARCYGGSAAGECRQRTSLWSRLAATRATRLTGSFTFVIKVNRKWQLRQARHLSTTTSLSARAQQLPQRVLFPASRRLGPLLCCSPSTLRLPVTTKTTTRCPQAGASESVYVNQRLLTAIETTSNEDDDAMSSSGANG